MENKKAKFQEHLIKFGFFIPTAEIYGGLAGFYDYGPIGVRIKNKYIELWRKEILDENTFEIDGSVILPYNVLKASGHVDSFTDPITICKKCKSVFRADKLIEEVLGINADGFSKEQLEEELKKIKCPVCGGELGEVSYFNLMFELKIGAYTQAKTGFLRPETAQSIFLNYNRIYKSFSPKFPFAIAQVGKAFRNEISPRKFLVRLREFYQMEIEFFTLRNPDCKKVNCGECKKCLINNHPKFEKVKDVEINILREGKKEWERDKVENWIKKGVIPNESMGYYMGKEWLFLKRFIPEEDMWFREIPKNELPHYSLKNFDLEVKSEFGIIEVWPVAYRTDHDLKTHSQKSGVDLRVDYEGKKVYPHVIEPSTGIERPLLIILEKAYREGDRKYPWLELHPLLSPYIISIHPLLKKPGFIEKARKVYNIFGKDAILYIKDSIGKAYAKMDSIGVPYNITIDYQTFEDNTVTIRFRNTKEQIRVKIDDLKSKIEELIKNYPAFS